jgi:glutathione S-transferase
MLRIALRVDDDMRQSTETKLQLYDRSTSGHSYKARLLLAFLEIPYEKVDVPLDGGRNNVDGAYSALNPRGQIPTLVHGELVLWGSTAILTYLAFQFDPTKTWLPEQPASIGRVMQWLELAQNEVTSGLFRARAIRRFGYSGDLEQASRDGTKALEVLNQELKDHDWLSAEHPTIADIGCFPYVALASEGGFDLSGYRGICQWIDRFKRLPRFTAMPGIDRPDLGDQRPSFSQA